MVALGMDKLAMAFGYGLRSRSTVTIYVFEFISAKGEAFHDSLIYLLPNSFYYYSTTKDSVYTHTYVWTKYIVVINMVCLHVKKDTTDTLVH